MNTRTDKTQKNKSQSAANGISQKRSFGKSSFQFVDNRPEAIAQRKLQVTANNSLKIKRLKTFQDMANNSPKAKQATQLQSLADNHSAQQQQTIQKKANNTGLHHNLKTGMKSLLGMSLDDEKVYRNADKPAQLDAHAYAQETDIHFGFEQKKHLPHDEAWHVVQQKQRRVKPTIQLKGGIIQLVAYTNLWTTEKAKYRPDETGDKRLSGDAEWLAIERYARGIPDDFKAGHTVNQVLAEAQKTKGVSFLDWKGQQKRGDSREAQHLLSASFATKVLKLPHRLVNSRENGKMLMAGRPEKNDGNGAGMKLPQAYVTAKNNRGMQAKEGYLHIINGIAHSQYDKGMKQVVASFYQQKGLNIGDDLSDDLFAELTGYLRTLHKAMDGSGDRVKGVDNIFDDNPIVYDPNTLPELDHIKPLDLDPDYQNYLLNLQGDIHEYIIAFMNGMLNFEHIPILEYFVGELEFHQSNLLPILDLNWHDRLLQIIVQGNTAMYNDLKYILNIAYQHPNPSSEHQVSVDERIANDFDSMLVDEDDSYDKLGFTYY